jgi:hypothetical protein
MNPSWRPDLEPTFQPAPDPRLRPATGFRLSCGLRKRLPSWVVQADPAPEKCRSRRSIQI